VEIADELEAVLIKIIAYQQNSAVLFQVFYFQLNEVC